MGARREKFKKRTQLTSLLTVMFLLLTTCPGLAAMPQNQQLPDNPKPQQNTQEPLPDSPTPQNNAPQAQDSEPVGGEQNSDQPGTTPNKAAENPSAPAEPSSESPAEPDFSGNNQFPGDADGDTNTTPAPKPDITTLPPGATPSDKDENAREKLFKLTVNVNFVTVPVTVKDESGFPVAGLLPQDFSVLENGTKQNLAYFTSDPFPLSAAVVVDLSMPDIEVQKIRNTLGALTGAFGQFDEVAVYSYGNTVKKWQGYMAATKIDPDVVRKLKTQHGANSTVPVTTGPMAQSGPTVNGRNMDGTPVTPGQNATTAVRQSHVLNDAILTAALDLSKRDRTRRKIIFVVSDGRELGSTASYADVMKVLLSNEIAVYAVGVGGSAIPGYGKLQKIHLPGTGYGDLLPKYASATGGDVLTEFSESAIETAYSRITEEARNQYTLGYMARATASSAYRNIEVIVSRGGLKVYAKDGYYPAPPEKK